MTIPGGLMALFAGGGAISWVRETIAAPSTANPVTSSINVTGGKLVTLAIVSDGAARAGGSPTLGGVVMTLGAATSTTSGGAEVWYALVPLGSGSKAISVPNSGGLNIQLGATLWNSDGTITHESSVSTTTETGTDPDTHDYTNTKKGGLIVQALQDGSNSLAIANSHTESFSTDLGGDQGYSQYHLPITVETFTFSVTFGGIGFRFCSVLSGFNST